MKLSVVIPVFNGEKYLPACLDSLRNQFRQPDEIIVIDDGSTDSTPLILADYASRLPAMRVVRQENQGVSVARNLGLQQARGQYVSFLDADDFFEPDMLARMLELAECESLDITICNVMERYEDSNVDRLLFQEKEDVPCIEGRAWLCRRLKGRNMFHGVCMHLYRRDFLLQGGCRFVPGMRYEDVVWTTEVLLKAERVGFIARALYHYRCHIRPKGDSAAQVAALERVIRSSMENARSLEAIAMRPSTDSRAKYWIRWQLVDGGLSVFHRLDQLPTPESRADALAEIRANRYWRLLWRNAVDWSLRRKVLTRCLKYSLWKC